MKQIIFVFLILSMNSAFGQNQEPTDLDLDQSDLAQALIEEEIFSSDKNPGELDEDPILPIQEDTQDVGNLYGLEDENDNQPFGFFVEQGEDEVSQENKQVSSPQEADTSEESAE